MVFDRLFKRRSILVQLWTMVFTVLCAGDSGVRRCALNEGKKDGAKGLTSGLVRRLGYRAIFALPILNKVGRSMMIA